MDVFFLFPGRVLIVYICHLDPNRQRTLPGKSLLSVLEPSAVILNFGFEVNTFFNCFSTLFDCSVRAWAVVRTRNIGRVPVVAPGPQRSQAWPIALLFALRTLFR